jgi:hypothetical protein
MEEIIKELLRNEQVEEAIERYRQEHGVSQEEAREAIKGYQSELPPIVMPNHSSDTPFSFDEVLMLEDMLRENDESTALEYLKDRYELNDREARLSLNELKRGNKMMPSYDFNTEAIIKLLERGQRPLAVKKYRELYDVSPSKAVEIVGKIEDLID